MRTSDNRDLIGQLDMQSQVRTFTHDLNPRKEIRGQIELPGQSSPLPPEGKRAAFGILASGAVLIAAAG
ncbi:MAG: hypothetical protein JO336_13585 [Acidobacteriia bacterium]|nr:hypothetical protein [Terriglobia bacterium]